MVDLQSLWPSTSHVRRSRRAAGALAIAAILFMAGRVSAEGTLYLIDGVNLYTVDTTTAAVTLIGAAFEDGLAPTGPGASLYSTDEDLNSLYSLPVDGTPQTFLATIGGDANRGLAFNTATGVLYGTDNGVFGSIDPATGDFMPLQSPPSETEALAADPNRNVVYGLDTDIEDLMVYDVATDMWSVAAPTGVENGGKAGMAYDPEADLLYVADRDGTGNLYSVDPTTGATTWIGPTDVDSSFYGLAFVPAEIFSDGFESGDTSAWSNAVP